jgi:hypothetical protein
MPPAVVIEQVLVNQQSVSPNSTLQLPRATEIWSSTMPA